MIGIKNDMEVALREFAARTTEPDVHPGPEDLFAYLDRDLQEDAVERIREHLAFCPRCSRLVLDLENFPNVKPLHGKPPSRATVSRSWEVFRERIHEGALESGDLEMAEPWASAGPLASRPLFVIRDLLPAIAAVLLILSIGLSGLVVSLRKRVGELSRPEVHVLLADLVPVGEAGIRARDSSVDIRVPGWADRVIIILNLFESSVYSEYHVEISDASQTSRRMVWSHQDLRRSPDRNFVLELPREFLPPGRYRIDLFGVDGERRVQLAEYLLALDFE